MIDTVVVFSVAIGILLADVVKYLIQKIRIVDGYGVCGLNNKQYRAHRIVYEQTYGPIPSGLFILHTCDNPKCCNPSHLHREFYFPY